VGNSANVAESNTVNFTVSAWVYPNSTAGVGQIFSSGGGFSARIQLRQDTADWMLYVKNSAGSYLSAGFPGGVTPNAWSYLVATWDGANIKLYVNGVLKATTPDPSPTTYAGTVNDWGYNTDGGTPVNWWNGRIDEGRVSGAALTAGWIASEYNNQNSPTSFYTVGPEAAPAVGVSMLSVPAAIPNGHSGNITLTLTGSGTAWNNSSTVFTVAGVSNVTKVSQNVTGATTATLVLRTGAGTGTLNISETVTGSAVTAIDVAPPSFSLDVALGNLNSVQTLTLTGKNTLWSQDGAGPFSVTGGAGSGIGAPAITSNTAGTIALTVGSSAGVLTITDTSTGKTATFAAGNRGGSSGCQLVLAQ
jgi:hypothetical protein